MYYRCILFVQKFLSSWYVAQLNIISLTLISNIWRFYIIFIYILKYNVEDCVDHWPYKYDHFCSYTNVYQPNEIINISYKKLEEIQWEKVCIIFVVGYCMRNKNNEFVLSKMKHINPYKCTYYTNVNKDLVINVDKHLYNEDTSNM